VRHPHFPFHFWSDDALRCISNTLRKYIDRVVPRENMFSYVRICIDVDLESGVAQGSDDIIG